MRLSKDQQESEELLNDSQTKCNSNKSIKEFNKRFGNSMDTEQKENIIDIDCNQETNIRTYSNDENIIDTDSITIRQNNDY